MRWLHLVQKSVLEHTKRTTGNCQLCSAPVCLYGNNRYISRYQVCIFVTQTEKSKLGLHTYKP